MKKRSNLCITETWALIQFCEHQIEQSTDEQQTERYRNVKEYLERGMHHVAMDFEVIDVPVVNL